MDYVNREDLIKENKELKLKIKELEETNEQQKFFWTGDADKEFLKKKCMEQQKIISTIKIITIFITVLLLCGTCFLVGLTH